MKKYGLLASLYLIAQSSLFAQEPAYINYNAALGGALTSFVQKADTALWSASLASLQKSARTVQEEAPVGLPLEKKGTTKKAFTDEALYANRKSGVVVIGNLRKGTAGNNINFEVKGTGFFITKEGHCVTNFHVVQELLQSTPPTDGLVYFVITEDRKVYAINGLLAYSKNNDLAVLSINGGGQGFNAIPLGQPAVVGAPVYCISHPAGEFYYFSKGMVARNLIRDSTALGVTYSASGKTPIRMEVTADYGGGSSGGPLIDQYGNLVGIVATTSTIYLNEQLPQGVRQHPQMVIKDAVPVKALTGLLQ
ncbi:serine protease [Paraflavitalea soli]|uniref:Serine protease n=1 Tax=Paraflavitalea soli TaxID=2315862 RepID=A0A3B7MH44_9BACT|nr:serine protease [Paraflavitalea soli]AXY73712.1 serine protease [Paraflavitalea soli]